MMSDIRISRSTYSRREFLAVSSVLSAAAIGTRFKSSRLNAAETAEPFHVVSDWPRKNCPQYMSRGIDADAQGRIYVAGDADHPVLIISSDGKYVSEWGKGLLITPHGLRIQRDTVWVTDIETQMAHQFTLDGKLMRSFGVKGQAGDAPEQFNRPTDFAFGPDGAIYISDGYKNTRVVCRAADGTIRRIWGKPGNGPGQFNLVHAIAIDKTGRVFVADRSNDRLQIFDLNGKYITQWNHIGRPYGLEVCENGNLFICGMAADHKKFRVIEVTNEGEILTEFGDTGTGPGEFLMAHSVHVDSQGDVLIADGKANRVQKFTRS